jgi:hypothetical protein
VTSIEIKSGYGLEIDTELRQLAIARRLAQIVEALAGRNDDLAPALAASRALDWPGRLAPVRDHLERAAVFAGETIQGLLAAPEAPQPIVAAVDGVCAGAGAILAMASDIRYGTPRSKVYFLFNKVGLAGCDMGACAMLPRIIGQGRAAELLYTGRVLRGEEAERWGFLIGASSPARSYQMSCTWF